MPFIYKRKISVSVAGFKIEEPRIELDIQRKASDTPDTCSVMIYNLSRQNEQRIKDKGTDISVEAGYQNRTGIIFQGKIARVTRERKQLARITKIWLGVGGAGPTGLRGTFSMSYKNPTTVRKIVADIAQSFTPPLDLGPLNAIPANLEKKTWNQTSPSSRALTALLDGFDIDWYEDNGVLRFNREGITQADKSTIKINPKTGMIGTPTETENGLRVRSFLNPLLELGVNVDIESEQTPSVNGRYKVVELMHRGDNWDGQFTTDLELRPSDGATNQSNTADEVAGLLRT